MNRLYLVLVVVLAGSVTTTVTFAQSDQQIPGWVRDTALWWGQGVIDDSEFVNLIQFLIDMEIITVPVSLPQIQALEEEVARLKGSIAADIRDAYDRGYADGKNAVSSGPTAGSSHPAIVQGMVTKNIDGNTIEISGERIRSPFVWVEDSGNKTADHAKYAKQLCPVGSAAYYDTDDNQPVGKYGRTIAMVWCEGQTKSLDQLMVESGLGWINTYYCQKSEFKGLDWVDDCRDDSRQ